MRHPVVTLQLKWIFFSNTLFNLFKETITCDYKLMETPVVTSNMISDIMQKITLSSSSSDLQISSLKLFQIGDQCQEHNVNLYIDAEYSHLQPAVRLLTLCLMKKYNKIGGQGPFVYNTYQCYLKDSISHLSHDIELAKSIHIPLACKLVR